MTKQGQIELPQIPRTQKALLIGGPSKLVLRHNAPTPIPSDNEVLIKVVAVALNPSDVKMMDYNSSPGGCCGSDLAGYVTVVGKHSPKSLKIGDCVSTFVFGGNRNRPGDGAFAEYVVARPEFCIRLPRSISLIEGASLGVGLTTCGLALRSLGLIDDNGKNTAKWTADCPRDHVLVYGGSTATGTLAIQLLVEMGYIPVSTCSSHNFDLVRNLGAAEVFDSKLPSCRERLREATSGTLRYALDCIGNTNSATVSYGAIGINGGKYTSLLPFPERLRIRRKNVEPDWVLGYTIFGTSFELEGGYAKEASYQDQLFMIAWVSKMERLLSQGYLRPHPISTQGGGLSGISDGLSIIRQQKLSGKKAVYVIEPEYL